MLKIDSKSWILRKEKKKKSQDVSASTRTQIYNSCLRTEDMCLRPWTSFSLHSLDVWNESLSLFLHFLDDPNPLRTFLPVSFFIVSKLLIWFLTLLDITSTSFLHIPEFVIRDSYSRQYACSLLPFCLEVSSTKIFSFSCEDVLQTSLIASRITSLNSKTDCFESGKMTLIVCMGSVWNPSKSILR